MEYKIFCGSIRGPGHVEKNQPCEDSGKVAESDSFKIFALGDGHGDDNCMRANIGSERICRIACEELASFAEQIESECISERIFEESEQKEQLKTLIKCIIGKWSLEVNEHFKENPLSEDELNMAKKYRSRYENNQEIEHIYGTTLIAGLLTKKYLLLLQQGDGKCLVFNSDGSVVQPIPWDDRCFLNSTTSVCDSDAAASCRYAVLNIEENPIIACFAGSDGIDDSFTSEALMEVFYRSLLVSIAEEGMESFCEGLEERLSSVSERGSKDDTTLCGIVNEDAIGLLGDIEKQNEIVLLEHDLDKVQEKISEMNDKLEFLKNRKSEAEEELEKYTDMMTKHDEILSDLNGFEEEFECANEPDSFKNKIIQTVQKITNSTVAKLEKVLPELIQNMRSDLERTIEKQKPDYEAALKKKEEREKEYIEYKNKYDSNLERKSEIETSLKGLKEE